ncbi:MAG: ExbD/TolR family protein [Phycisphaerales bacterium]
MTRRRKKKHRAGGLTPNLTPMVDVVFLLIIFFVLVAQITSAERIDLELPRVADPRAERPGAERRIVVNIVPEDAEPGVWARVGTIELPPGERGEARLAEILLEARRSDPELRVVVRAGREEQYQRVFPVMEACRTAGVPRARLAATERDG